MKFSLINQFIYELRSIIFGYPRFVFTGTRDSIKNSIPVFVFHTIEPEEFESQLKYLQENSYKTLSIDEFYNAITKCKDTPQSSVLLTIDDARSSFWRYGYPLLTKYKMKATLFVIPGFTQHRASNMRSLSDVWSGNCHVEDVVNQDNNDSALCSWEEIIEMKNSGMIDIQNHSLFHKEVFTSNKLKSVFSNNETSTPYNSSITPYLTTEEANKNIRVSEYVGLPLFDTMPLLAAKRYYKMPAEFLSSCQARYRKATENGNKQPNMQMLVREINKEVNISDLSLASIDEVIETIIGELELSVGLLNDKLGNDSGFHFCLPFAVGSEATIKAAKAVGIKSCFWGVIPGKRDNKPDDDPYYISRIKNDFLLSLPGKGRRGFLDIYLKKFLRRLAKKPVF